MLTARLAMLAHRQVPRRWQLRACLFWATLPALTITAGAICYNTHIIDKVTHLDPHTSTSRKTEHFERQPEVAACIRPHSPDIHIELAPGMGT